MTTDYSALGKQVVNDYLRGDRCLIICIGTDDDGLGYWCDECPNNRPPAPPLSPAEQATVHRFEQAAPFPCAVCDELGVVEARRVDGGVVCSATYLISCPVCSPDVP